MQEVDLRSDTVTHPSPEMREAIANAKIGDDVFSDDPSVNRLEEMAANAMGKEAAVYVASGTMGNDTVMMKEGKKASHLSDEKVWEFPHWHTRAEGKRLFLGIKLIFFDLKVVEQLL